METTRVSTGISTFFEFSAEEILTAGCLDFALDRIQKIKLVKHCLVRKPQQQFF